VPAEKMQEIEPTVSVGEKDRLLDETSVRW